MGRLSGIIVVLLILCPVHTHAKGNDEVFDAVVHGDLAQVKKFLADDPSHLNRRLLGAAVNSGQKEIIKYLLGQGVDVNGPGWMNMTALNHLLSPWGWSGERDSEELRNVVELLIESGADLNRLDLYGANALYWAVESGRTRIVKLLIEQGSKPFLTQQESKSAGENIFYTTALHRACMNGNMDIVKILVERGVPKDVRDSSSALPVDNARERGYDEIVSYLDNASASYK